MRFAYGIVSSSLESVATEIKRYKSEIGIGITVPWVSCHVTSRLCLLLYGYLTCASVPPLCGGLAGKWQCSSRVSYLLTLSWWLWVAGVISPPVEDWQHFAESYPLCTWVVWILSSNYAWVLQGVYDVGLSVSFLKLFHCKCSVYF